MLHEFDLVIPAQTPASAPAELDAVLTAGKITQVEVQIPLGCRGLVFTAGLIGIHQQWPSNPGGTIKGDGARIVFGEELELLSSPFLVTLQGWSPTTVFQHVITWRFTLTPAPEKTTDRESLLGTLGRIFSPLGPR